MFKVGDKVAHPGHGGCTVRDVCTQPGLKGPVKYLVLTSQSERDMRILVPVDSLDKVGVRDIMSEETADKLLDSFADAEAGNTLVWENNFSKRRQVYSDILKTGSLDALADMIRELTRQPKLGNGDKEMLPRAQKKLFSEIALAKDMELSHVMELANCRIQPVL